MVVLCSGRCFFWDSLGSIFPKAQFLTSEHHCRPSASIHDNCVHQQNNASWHTARIVKEWAEEHDGGFLLMPWPPKSPDMNPIKDLWFHLEKQVLATSPPPENVWELEDLQLTLWHRYQIPQETYCHLVNQCLSVWPLFCGLKEVPQVIR
ncbi:hemicentin-2-like [Tachysurus ichikawai]